MISSSRRPLDTLIAAMGRLLVLFDDELQVVGAFGRLGAVSAPAQRLEGRSAREILGGALADPGGPLERALSSGETWEGLAAALHVGGSPARRVGCALFPIPAAAADLLGPEAAVAALLRPVVAATDRRREPPPVFCGMAGRSVAMRRVFQQIERLREHTTSVLIQGESGTGKEMVARALHQTSPRRRGPFVPVNCAALAEGVLESELFGHARGAFTGAVSARPGRFEAASGGTLFLDEIAESPLPLQAKLLRVIERGTFERVGENRERTSDARIVAATHGDLEAAVRQGRFRADLYYRLRVVALRLAPLRERPEDVVPLVDLCLFRLGARYGRELSLAPAALDALLRYPWPGNIRELEHALEHAVALGEGGVVEIDDLPSEVLDGSGGVAPAAAAERAPRPDAELLRSTLAAHRWRRGPAASALGVSRSTLWRWIREVGLD